jgi:hypothetical protein
MRLDDPATVLLWKLENIKTTVRQVERDIPDLVRVGEGVFPIYEALFELGKIDAGVADIRVNLVSAVRLSAMAEMGLTHLPGGSGGGADWLWGEDELAEMRKEAAARGG